MSTPVPRSARDILVMRWAPRIYAAMAISLVPWIVYLSIALPDRATTRHYRLSWIGFDVLLVALLARTAYLAARQRPQAEMPAAATATLLLVDAWFDITTSPSHAQFVVALLLALVVEIPVAVSCLVYVRRIEVRRRAAAQALAAGSVEPVDDP